MRSDPRVTYRDGSWWANAHETGDMGPFATEEEANTWLGSVRVGVDSAVPGSDRNTTALVQSQPCPTCAETGHTGVWNPHRQAYDVCWNCGDKGYVLVVVAEKNDRTFKDRTALGSGER